MTYKAFEDFYKDADIKHLLLQEYQGVLVSPPFCTDNCKDYNQLMIVDGQHIHFIDLDLPPATSKFSGHAVIGDSIWFIPYGIWDHFDVVLEIKNFKPIYHSVGRSGKGQFYNMDTDGSTGFSFPLGYEDTNFCLYIKDGQVHTIDFEKQPYSKLHMGTVYCNGRYWSAPRSDGKGGSGYINMMSFDGKEVTTYPINVSDHSITRKYSDMVSIGNTLYALPFGEQPGMNEVLEFDTETNEYSLHKLNIPDFSKKFNCMVIVDEYIFGLPYGTKKEHGSNYGVIFNTIDKSSKFFDIGNDLGFGGKYRFRCGVNYNNKAVFFPTGTPSCPIISVDKNLNVISKYIEGILFGRPILYKNNITVIGYYLEKKCLSLFFFDENLSYTEMSLGL